MGCNDVAKGIRASTLPQFFGAPNGVLPGMGNILALEANPSRSFLLFSETPEVEPGSRREELGSGGSPGRDDHPMGLGDRSCSHTQGIANVCQLWGQEGIFPLGQTGTCLQEFFFFPSSAALSRAPCHGSPGIVLMSSCLLLLQQLRDAFSP